MRLPLVLLAALSMSFAAPPARSQATDDTTSAVAALRQEAVTLRPLAKSDLTRRFLRATETLPRVEAHTVLYDSSRTHYYDSTEAAALPDTARARLIERKLDEGFWYYTRYGSPLAYVLPLEVLARHGVKDVAGKRIADFGYGTIGHLELLAALGADATGIDVDRLLEKLYADAGDRAVTPLAGGRAGRRAIATGSWPGDGALRERVGGRYDVFLSKNTLKRGYIHPEQQVDPRMLVHLGVDDSTYLRAVFESLAPGGLFLVYNLTPAPNAPGKPYRPMADGRSPFARGALERAGFEVVSLDVDDSAAARAVGHALGWDAGPQPMDLANDLFATWTLARRPAARGKR